MTVMEPEHPSSTRAELVPTPFLRWAGGKRWLVHHLEDFVPRSPRCYFEPFLGAGAAFFKAMPGRAYLSDSNRQLITTFKIVRNYADELGKVLRGLRCERSLYYRMRASQPKTPLETAVRFIYLNRCSWNGLYRVNSRGDFNVPYGGEGRNPQIWNEGSLHAAAEALSNATLASCDFAEALELAGPDDFVFADPPYTVTHGDNGFLLYNELIFSWKDQQRLKNCLVGLHKKGGLFLLTNADHPAIRRLYAGFPIRSVSRSSILAADPSHRRRVTELLITNYT